MRGGMDGLFCSERKSFNENYFVQICYQLNIERSYIDRIINI